MTSRKDIIEASEEVMKRHEVTFLKLRISELEDKLQMAEHILDEIRMLTITDPAEEAELRVRASIVYTTVKQALTHLRGEKETLK